MVKAARHHTNHGVQVAIQRDRPAQDAGISAELTLPQAVAQHGHPRPARGRLLGPECPSEKRFRAEHAKEIGVEPITDDRNRVADASQAVNRIARSRDLVEDAVATLPFAKHRYGNGPDAIDVDTAEPPQHYE